MCDDDNGWGGLRLGIERHVILYERSGWKRMASFKKGMRGTSNVVGRSVES